MVDDEENKEIADMRLKRLIRADPECKVFIKHVGGLGIFRRIVLTGGECLVCGKSANEFIQYYMYGRIVHTCEICYMVLRDSHGHVYPSEINEFPVTAEPAPPEQPLPRPETGGISLGEGGASIESAISDINHTQDCIDILTSPNLKSFVLVYVREKIDDNGDKYAPINFKCSGGAVTAMGLLEVGKNLIWQYMNDDD